MSDDKKALPGTRFGEITTEIFQKIARYNQNATTASLHHAICTTKDCPGQANLDRQGVAIMDEIIASIDQLRNVATEIRNDRAMTVSSPSTSVN